MPKKSKSVKVKKLPKTPPKHFSKLDKMLYREGKIGLDRKPLYAAALPTGIAKYEGELFIKPKKRGRPKKTLTTDVIDLEGITFMEEPPEYWLPTPVTKIKQKLKKENEKFGINTYEYDLEVMEDTDISGIIELLPDLVFETLEYEDLGMTDKVSVSIEDYDDGGIYFESDFMEAQNIEDILELIQEENYYYNWIFDTEKKAWVVDSAKSLLVRLRIIKLGDYVGAGQKKIINKSDIKLKKSVCCIKNDDDLCLGRCIVCAIAARDKHPQLKQIKMGRKIQTELTHKLYEDLFIEKKISNYDMIKDFENKLDCCITIVDSNQFNNVIYPDIKSDDYEVKDFNIYLLKDGEHFDLINNNQVAGFFCKNNWCDKCKKPYNIIQDHRCEYKCGICCSTTCDFIGGDFKKVKYETWKENKCKDCWRSFPTEKCFDNHKNKELITKGKNKGKYRKSRCETIFKCPKCKVLYDKEKFSMDTHRCGDYWCGNCGVVANDKEHKCYMMPKKVNNPNENVIFFDFEATQDTGQHIVNYAIAEYYDSPEPIEFFNIKDFMEWLLQDKHKGYTIIAHNGRGYDFQLIQEYIYKHTTMKPKNVYAGSKIMILNLKDLNMRFVDSLNFLTMKLEAFPKTFGIKELKKGFFPHYYNTEENFNYIGKIPPMRYFGYNAMSKEKREEFVKWWVGKRLRKETWNMYEEIKGYCISDVDILRRSCIIFRELYLDIADIDPFSYTTIASVYMAIFKNKYILEGYEYSSDKEEELLNKIKVTEEEKIAILPYEQQQFIRKSFFGGRTNATKLKYIFKGEEVGKYIDITSLYPAVNYYDEYPTGHPIEITENFGDPKQYFGFIECEVECPKDLYFPVLANKGKKLMFDLEDKRGVWATIELNKAIDMGYKVKKIHKVLHFKKRSRNIFKEYVATFLKIKQEASGFPDWVKTQEDKLKYLKEYHNSQGILLDIDKINYNPGLRAIAKLCLNSLWGKFGQRLNMPKTEIVSDKKRFHDIMLNNDYERQNYHFIDEDRLEVTWKEKEESIEANFNTNIAIASYTTSHARLRLYHALETLGDQVLYHDTDSCVYVYDKNNPQHKDFELGDCLGEWTDELEGWTMKGTFISGGPKNYSYEKHKDNKIKYETKIKGFTLNYEATQKDKLNHNSMIRMIDNHISGTEEQKNKIEVEYFMINRNKKTKQLTSYTQKKKYGFCYDKRHILQPDEWGNIDTLPFGHKDIVE